MNGEASTKAARLARNVAMLVVGALCIGYLARVLFSKRDQIAQAFDLSWGAFALLVFLMFFAHLQRTFEFTFMLRRLDVHEPAWEGFWLTGAALLLNHLPFSAGSVVRAVVLRRKHNLPYASYLSVLMVGAIVNGAVSALFGLVATAVAAPHPAAMLPLLVVFGGLFVGGSCAVLLPKSLVPRGNGLIARQLRGLVEGAVLIRGNGFGLVILALLTVTKLLANALRMWLCFRAFGLDVRPIAAALLASTTLVMSLVNLTPGNLGLREVVLGGVSTVLGFNPALGMAAASLDRAILFGYVLILGVPGMIVLNRRRAATAPSEAGQTARSG